MSTTRRDAVVSAVLGSTLAAAPPARAAAAGAGDFAALAQAQGARNAQPGPRTVPGRSIPVPEEGLSERARTMVAAPYPAGSWNYAPPDTAEWNRIIAKAADDLATMTRDLQAALGLEVEQREIAGVPCFVLTPPQLPERNRGRLVLHLHGGGYVHNPGLSGTGEGMLLAAMGGFEVISVDYRMAPDHPYPAAMDDATAVWKQAVTMRPPGNIAVFGSSTGGAMTLALVLRAKGEGLPLPAAIAPGTPWSDLTDAGDSYATNEWLDNVLVSNRGYLSRMAAAYAGAHDRRDPQISPIYGDYSGFPPALLTTGTRDLFLSNTVRTHRKLRRAGVEAELHVYEGLSHAQYIGDPQAPETREATLEIAAFFDRHLGR